MLKRIQLIINQLVLLEKKMILFKQKILIIFFT